MDNDPITVVSALIEAGTVDTVYRDIYLERAGALLGPTLSREAFRRLEQQQAVSAIASIVAQATEEDSWHSR
jgi:hypothetical protein